MNWVPNAAFTQPERVFELVLDELQGRGIRDMLYLGFCEVGALYVPVSVLESHAYVVGPSRSGKSARVISPIVAQLIRSGRRVWLIDCKPDLALWGQLHEEASRAGRRAAFFSLYPGVRSDFGLDLFADLQARSPHGVATHLMSALALDGAKENYFTQTNLACLEQGVTAARKKGRLNFESLFKEMYRLRRAFPHAQHALDTIQLMSRERAFNMQDSARSLESVAASDEVVYFCVPVSSEKGDVGKAAANLVLRMAALSQRDASIKGNARDRIYVVVDEFQDVSSAGDIRELLCQASGNGVSLVLGPLSSV